MVSKEKLFQKAKKSPANFPFTKLCSLAEKVGFEFRTQSGSHKIYKHPKLDKLINFQPDKKNKGMEKKYQVDELVNIIEENNLIKE